MWTILFCSAISLAAEKKITLVPYLDFNYSNNIFWDASKISDATFSPGLGFSFNTRLFNLFLNANSKIYLNNDYLNSSMITGGFNFFKVISSRSSFFFSPDFSLTAFKGDMSYLNTTISSLAIGMKHIFSDHLFSRFGLNIRHSNYLHEDSYDRLRLAAFWEMSTFFKTQTTIRLTLGMNYLFFPHIVTETTTTTGYSLPAEEFFASAASTEPRYRRSNPNPVAPIPPQPSPNQPLTQTSVVFSTIDLAIPQPYFVFRVAQGLGFQTGINAEFLFRKNQTLLQGMQAIGASEWALEQMDEDFFWQGARFSLGIKTEAILDLEIALDFSYSLKQYQGIDALDLDGYLIQPQVFRSDKLSQINLQIAKSFGHFGFYITGSYRKNLSNDLYFRYGFYTISTGLDYVM